MGCSAVPRNTGMDLAHLPGSGFLHHVNAEGWSGKRLRLSALRHPHPRSSVPLPPVRSKKNRGDWKLFDKRKPRKPMLFKAQTVKKVRQKLGFFFFLCYNVLDDKRCWAPYAGRTDGKCAVVKGNQNREVTEYDRKNENSKKAPSLDALDRIGVRNSRGSLWDVSW